MSDEAGVLHIPAQAIPVPQSLSIQARAFLTGMISQAAIDRPPGGDQVDSAARAIQMLGPAAAGFIGTFEEAPLGNGALLYRAAPTSATGRLADAAYFDIHGGGFTAGGGEMCRMLAKIRAADYGAQVFAVDYRLAPKHPYPAALDDCMAAYREILTRVDPANLVVAGSSAGGNLAAALMLRARDEGLPWPAGLLLMTPAMDILGAGDSRTTNRYLDVSLYGGGGAGPGAYLGETDPRDPYISPIFGEIGLGWPPTLLTTGTRDLLLSDTVMMHRKLREAGVVADLLVTEGGMHIGFMGSAPEDHFVMAESRKFVQRIWGIAG
ncbi:MAG: putative esterase [Novosphingobium sp.]|nr:putative esterase [Novosphingobium sp.]